jgi:hypothetical protein
MGELLDAAVEVTRGSARALLPAAALLAILEQVAMVALRREFFDGAIAPDIARVVGPAWLAVSAGAGMESAIIALLGLVAGRAAAASAVGTDLRPAALLRPRKLGGVLIVALVAGATTFALTLLPLGWLVGYPLFGLAVAALVIDRCNPARALGRGVKLLLRSGGRAALIRLLSYFSWLLLRLGFGLGAITALSFLGLPLGGAAGLWLTAACLALVNTIAYATLASLDAVLHLETRIRTEGLDIALSRVPGPLTTGHLAVAR